MRLLATGLASLLVIPSMAMALSMEEKEGEISPEKPVRTASITLVKDDDYPDYKNVIGSLNLPGVDAQVLEETDPQWLRLALVDKQDMAALKDGLVIYQTVTTGVEMPLNLNFVVNSDGEGYCFNPEVPYCGQPNEINDWLRQQTIDSVPKAGERAGFAVDMGMSFVIHPENILYASLQLDMRMHFNQYIRGIESIYVKKDSAYRTEQKRAEYDRVIAKYSGKIVPVSIESVGDVYRLQGWTYKVFQSNGDLREWTVIVHKNGRLEMDMKELEQGVGELEWWWAE